MFKLLLVLVIVSTTSSLPRDESKFWPRLNPESYVHQRGLYKPMYILCTRKICRMYKLRGGA